MDDLSVVRQMINNAVNECNDTELLDLIYKLLVYEENDGGKSTPTVVFLF